MAWIIVGIFFAISFVLSSAFLSAFFPGYSDSHWLVKLQGCMFVFTIIFTPIICILNICTEGISDTIQNEPFIFYWTLFELLLIILIYYKIKNKKSANSNSKKSTHSPKTDVVKNTTNNYTDCLEMNTSSKQANNQLEYEYYEKAANNISLSTSNNKPSQNICLDFEYLTVLKDITRIYGSECFKKGGNASNLLADLLPGRAHAKQRRHVKSAIESGACDILLKAELDSERRINSAIEVLIEYSDMSEDTAADIINTLAQALL